MSSSFEDDSSSTPSSVSNIHIVVDNSNLFIGAQLGQGKNGEQDASTRVNVANLVKIIENDKRRGNIKTRVVGGSTPPRNAKVWTEWKKCNYNCLLGERSMSNKEVFLDDMLHSQIQNIILRNKTGRRIKQNLVLISGDGNNNDNRTSFPEVVTIALDYGWTVQIWSWRASLSSKFLDIQRKYSNKIKINYLDTYRSNITFKQKYYQNKRKYNNYIKPTIYIILTLFIFLLVSFIIF